MDQGADSVQLSAYGVEESTEYRALSLLALVALVLGLLSPVCWAAPFLLIVPAAAVAAALVALAGIQRAEGRLTGAALARVGMTIALISAAAAVVRGPVRAALIERQLLPLAQEFVDRIADGRWDGALDLMTEGGLYSFSPQPAPGSPQPSEEEARATAAAEFRKHDVGILLSSGGPWRLRRIGPRVQPIDERTTVRVTATFELLPDDGAGKPADSLLQLEFLRAAQYEATGAPWRIARWSLVEPARAN